MKYRTMGKLGIQASAAEAEKLTITDDIPILKSALEALEPEI